MSLTILLSRVLGIFLVIVGAAILIRRHYFIPVFATFAEERLTRVIVCLIELLAGLFLIVVHNEWSSVPAGIISAIGWIALVESTAYLLLPDPLVEQFIRAFNKPLWYVVGGLFAVVVGVYLAAFGFGSV